MTFDILSLTQRTYSEHQFSGWLRPLTNVDKKTQPLELN